MVRRLAIIVALAPLLLAACSSGKSSSSGATTTTNADAYASAYTVCLQFYNTDAARNAEPAQITDDGADEIFVGLALQLKPAVQKDPRAWSKLNAAANTLRRELMAATISDDKIEQAISKMADACQAAKKRPSSLANRADVPMTPNSTSSTNSTTTTLTSP